MKLRKELVENILSMSSTQEGMLYQLPCFSLTPPALRHGLQKTIPNMPTVSSNS